MSYYMMLNSWMGEDQEHATEKMAKVFRMENSDALDVVDNLAGGNPWQFEHQISNQQSEVAEHYLRDLGFDVERIPIMNDDFMDDDMPEFSGGKKKGLFGKIKSLFSRKKK